MLLGIRQLGKFLQSYVALIAYVLCCAGVLVYVENSAFEAKQIRFGEQMAEARHQIHDLRRDTESRLKVFINASLFDQFVNDARAIVLPVQPDVWSFADGVFFMWSLLTTTGCDRKIPPGTFYGNVFVVVSSVCGIPVFLFAVYKMSTLIICLGLDILMLIEKGCLRRKTSGFKKTKVLFLILLSVTGICSAIVYKLGREQNRSFFESFFTAFLYWSTIGSVVRPSYELIEVASLADKLLIGLSVYIILAHLFAVPRIIMLQSGKGKRRSCQRRESKRRYSSTKQVYNVESAELQSPHVDTPLIDNGVRTM